MTQLKTLSTRPLAGEPPISLPETPAGSLLADFVAAFNNGDLAEMTRFMTQTYAASALQGQSPEERATWDLALHRDTGGLDLVHVEPESDIDIRAHARTRLTGDWFLIRLTVASQPPHALTAITTRSSQRPASLGLHPSLGDEEIVARLQDVLARLAQADMFSGALMIARGDQPIFKFACGMANQAYRVPNQIDTKFNVGSLCKSFTAVAIAQLAEKGLLAFDDPVIEHLPGYPREVAERVTIHHLLTHTSGMGHYWNAKFEAARPRLRRVSDFIPLVMDDPLLFEPGARFAYSNSGYILLGAIIEAASGEDYYDYVRRHIYEPAGMMSTDAYEMDRSEPNLAFGYTFNGLDDRPEFGTRRNNLFMHVVKGGPAGGAFSTVEDLFNFSRALTGNKLLSPRYTDAVLQGRVAMGRAEDKQYGYGFMLTQAAGRRVAGHSGTFAGIGARLDIYLGLGYTFVILSNYDPYTAQAIGNRLREWIAGF